MASLRLEGVVIGRDGHALGSPLAIGLEAGEALVVTGPNGAGKSTLLRTIAGLTPALGGRIHVDGLIAADGEAAIHPRQACHYIGHRNGLRPLETLAANLAFWRRYLGGDGNGNGVGVEEALDSLGLRPLAGIPAGYLSAGQQRRAALCRLAVAHRPLWLLDEPTNALDSASQALFLRLVARHLKAGGMVVAATHQPLEIGAVRQLVLGTIADGDKPARQPEDWAW